MKATLDEIEVGDTVILSVRGELKAVVVTKTTPLQITIEGGNRFTRHSGCKVGGARHQAEVIYAPRQLSYDTDWLTQFYQQRDARRAERETLLGIVTSVKWDSLPTSKLKEIIRLL